MINIMNDKWSRPGSGSAQWWQYKDDRKRQVNDKYNECNKYNEYHK